jgi:hypothetical protein
MKTDMIYQGCWVNDNRDYSKTLRNTDFEDKDEDSEEFYSKKRYNKYN